ncbi:hypothetical protein V6U90_16005 [Micromonospora sp. CPCC 206060]
MPGTLPAPSTTKEAPDAPLPDQSTGGGSATGAQPPWNRPTVIDWNLAALTTTTAQQARSAGAAR